MRRCLSIAIVLSVGGCVLDEVVVEPGDGGTTIGGSCKDNDDCQSGVCAQDTERCVECEQDAHCLSPGASRCAASACVACTNNSECNHVAARPECDEGTCVACTPETEDERCNGTSCDPANRQCTSTDLGSLETCERCVTDSECTAEHLCIELEYGDESAGTYCMQVDPGGCTRPYSSLITDVTSVRGEGPFDFCGIDANVTSCEAVLALFRDEDCPCEGFGARCERVGGVNDKCTYSCSGESECTLSGPGRTCATDYCGSVD